MNRFPEEAELTHIVKTEGIDDDLAESLGRSVATYHAEAPIRDLDASVLIEEILDELDRVLSPMKAMFAGDAGAFIQRSKQRWRDCRMRQALRYLAPDPPKLVAIGGYSGTGKTTVARAVAQHIGAAPGAFLIRSDVVRRTLLHCDPLERLGPEAKRKKRPSELTIRCGSRRGMCCSKAIAPFWMAFTEHSPPVLLRKTRPIRKGIRFAVFVWRRRPEQGPSVSVRVALMNPKRTPVWSAYKPRQTPVPSIGIGSMRINRRRPW